MNPMTWVLMQLSPLKGADSAQPTQNLGRMDAIQQHFQRTGTGTEVLLGVLVAVGIVLFAVLAQSIQKRRSKHNVDHPAKLFRRLLYKLDLTVPQRDIIRRMALDLRLENATVLLLSRRVFERYARRWLTKVGSSTSNVDHRLADLTRALYPAGVAAGVTSTIKGGSQVSDRNTPSSTPA